MSGVMSRRTRTAEAQLERILYILPAAARGGTVSIDEIARALDVDAATVLRDLEDATARSFYHPAGAVESFSITTDGRTVQVHAPHEFRRPVRLTARETLALGLGLRTLAAEADADRRAVILALAVRLEAELAAPDATAASAASIRPQPDAVFDAIHYDFEADIEADVDVEYDELALAFDDDGFRGVIADAIELRRVCTIWYLKPGEQAPAHRRIAPYRLVFADGMWYVAAYDVDRDGLRYFRMDRVLDATLSEAMSPDAPIELDALLAGEVPYAASDEIEVSVRYSPRVARWIVERTAAPLEDDGSVILRHRVADPRWIVRHVLQYGGDAVLERPESARRWVAEAAGKAG